MWLNVCFISFRLRDSDLCYCEGGGVGSFGVGVYLYFGVLELLVIRLRKCNCLVLGCRDVFSTSLCSIGVFERSSFFWS